jgi:SpoVK/Ycf46/Vps4 family AAA+-type ATPase
MFVNNHIKYLLQAVADGNMTSAKSYAKLICKEDKTERNRVFCETITKKIESAANMFELPANVKDILYMEDVATAWKPNRYFLTPREKAVFEKVREIITVSDTLANLGINYINSVLLYGDSGTGKTEFARFLSYALKLPFVYLNISTVIDSYLGGTNKHISKAFSFANTAPCIFLLDELDAIGANRANNGDGAEKEMTRAALSVMQETDHLAPGVILLAATNRLDLIDAALLRRFQIHHKVIPLTEQEAASLIKAYLDDIDLPQEILSDVRVNISASGETPAYTVRELIQSLAASIMKHSSV